MSEKTKKKLSKILKKVWMNEVYAREMFKKFKKKPNRLEIHFDNFLQLEFSKYLQFVK